RRLRTPVVLASPRPPEQPPRGARCRLQRRRCRAHRRRGRAPAVLTDALRRAGETSKVWEAAELSPALAPAEGSPITPRGGQGESHETIPAQPGWYLRRPPPGAAHRPSRLHDLPPCRGTGRAGRPDHEPPSEPPSLELFPARRGVPRHERE